MKNPTFLAIIAASLLLACGKSEQPTVPAPALTASLPTEPAGIAPAAPAAALETPPTIPSEAAPAAQPAPVRAAPQTTAAPIKDSAPQSPAPAAVPVKDPVTPTPKPDLIHGQKIYRQACAFCHDKGIAGAPKPGDAAAWSARLAQGMDVLYASSLRGKGAMPARGGNPSLTDADVKAAVDFLAAQSR